ncbi:dTDP-4-amino-4,6-dideoxy-D-galactose acyltransferase [Brenneria corticis]|uniref:dTDP-fucosamine acetyltransferase n=1 Tax=Brenneria corticis TaxID=2173106 RepID=A0A2U1TYZ9_9GAMM|nr:dTDP-4-amino-4,6-dideoxy-D-galactose acyltransferase [Brenneria sp. CFCC 11842]PWC14637.1 dTDP-4-amino-4,6-dideoxy-D-galactose acyltransferase [Brenneria sp. CFCC 11842]
MTEIALSAGEPSPARIHAHIEPLSWESRFFNLNSGKLDFSPSAPLLTADALNAYALTQAKIPADNMRLADALADCGFRLVEGEVDLCLELEALPTAEEPSRPRVAESADIPALRAAAAQVFALSRFRAPWYRPEDSGRFYAQWVENAVLGVFDHQCLLLENAAGEPQGWVTLRRLNAGEARIGLLAVWPGAAARGIGTQLMSAAETWCRRQGIQRLWVATQAGNVAALRLYLRRGARIMSTAYWLYR